jgi:deferrochelatase/peroxidase EfeB
MSGARHLHIGGFFMNVSAPAQKDKIDPGLATQHCLTLAIPLKPLAYDLLLDSGDAKRFAELFAKTVPHATTPDATTAAAKLNISPGGGLVHFADAVLLPVADRAHPDCRILVVAIYDGEWEPYIDAFLNNEALIDGLNTLVLPAATNIPGAPVPKIPVQDHWDDFKIWLKRIDANVKGHAAGYKPTAISYGPTASEIRNMLPGLPGTSGGAGQGFTGDPPSQTTEIAPKQAAPIAPAKVDLSDVQGLIVRGYTNMPCARYYFLAVADKVKARAALGKLARGEVEAPLPKVTTAAPWGTKPPACLNIGITAAGLAALGLDPATLAKFPTAFQRNSNITSQLHDPDRWGARDRETCEIVGDVDLSDISQWDEPYKSRRFHVVVMVQARNAATRDTVDAALRSFIQGAFSVAGTDDADDLRDSRIHFGYIDGIAQPQLAIEGLYDHDHPFTPDGSQGYVAAGAFLWGQPRNPAKPFLPPPPWPSQSNPFVNSSFCAFRKLSQDVASFEKFLDDAAQDAWRRKVPGFTGVRGDDKERVAAKLCGRWRSGVPLELSPNSPDDMAKQHPAQVAAALEAVREAKPPKQLNDFDYGEDYFAKTGSNAHILRANPRSAPEGADIASAHRVMRRAMPYGPQYQPGGPAADRGLIGPFIGLDLADQFEFIMGAWFVTGAAFTAPNPEPFLGPAGDFSLQFPTGYPATPRVTCPVYQPEPTKKGRHPQFITTKGSAYLFLPSIAALNHLAGLSS